MVSRDGGCLSPAPSCWEVLLPSSSSGTSEGEDNNDLWPKTILAETLIYVMKKNDLFSLVKKKNEMEVAIVSLLWDML